jgi:hypothetical protein
MHRLHFLILLKKIVLIYLFFFASSIGWAIEKPVITKKISRNMSSVESIILCPNNSPAPSGNVEFCPKCLNGSYRLAEGCPNEGGTGDSCPQGGCNGGMPTETSSSN